MTESIFYQRPRRGKKAPSFRTRVQLEFLETRHVPHNMALTPLVQVSGPSPFEGNPVEANDPPFALHSELNPQLAFDPSHSDHLVGAWVQDFARGIVAGVSFDGGTSWQSIVIPGTSIASGGTYQHNDSPWVSIAANGDVYVSLRGFDPSNSDRNAIFVCKSS